MSKQQKYLLAIDQGTTSSRAVIYNEKLQPLAQQGKEFKQHFPNNGWVEHDPEDIWETTLHSCREAIKEAEIEASALGGIGITNQRETTLLWDRKNGEVLHKAIVWQDRRTADYCQQLKDKDLEPFFQKRTGLLLDPYFSGTKLAWLLDNVEGARERAEDGELCFGTVDSYLLWRFTKGKVHATDASNASRTLMMNLETREWDGELLEKLNIPASLLPEIRDNTSDFGYTDKEWLGAEVPICAMVGDQQGALIGQACIEAGMLKSTYGTGCFALLNTGQDIIRSDNRLLSTLAYQLDGEAYYALEGSIFMAGAIIQWLRDSLGMLEEAAESEALAEDIGYEQSEIMVPAFTGLGAPYWDPDARAAILGMTRDTSREHLAAAALRSVAYQSLDLVHAMHNDGQKVEALRVDGGMTENDWFLQALADITGCPIERAAISEATSFGAAFLAGLQSGMFKKLSDISELHKVDKTFKPEISSEQRDKLRSVWLAAIDKVR
ncbi:glycerol kinase [Aliidiomarina minuta]|uniref:glycerol kinase n=1 Tax=Aliidiomarina minuta TaxID=880057 RepID=A0A432W9Y8_9GAMM|nr:glycerol kinase GlpK [Aliidiomarina minuta]RUO26845.1 glycerol kinase [Aliidiomarina minuta]